MVCLGGVCTGHKWPVQPPNSKQALPRLADTLPHMARLWLAYILRHGPFLAAWYFQMRRPGYRLFILKEPHKSNKVIIRTYIFKRPIRHLLKMLVVNQHEF